MDESPRKIETFAPFSAALDLTKLILFQPFDLGKWMVIGFAAFLAQFSGGAGGHLNYNRKFTSGNWSFHSTSHDFGQTSSGWPGWVWPLIAIGGVLLIAVVIVLMWLGARGRFIFADCVVKNRGAITEPWKEFKREGNSYFLFSLIVALVVLVVVGVAGAPLWIPFALHGDWPEGVSLFFGLTVLGLAGVIITVAARVVMNFMVPIMYRQRCLATKAFYEAIAVISRHLGPVILYVLFSVVLLVAFVALGCLLTCLTCCIAAIPYVGTVILLPVHVLFMAYLLLFVRQFGPEYDAWGNVPVIAAPTTVIEPPGPESPPLQG